jgi:GT2 family glycosyltransferase
MTTLSVVIPHWPMDEQTDGALRNCVSSFPAACERLVIVNQGTGYGHNVNIGLRIASGDYLAVVNNDCRVAEGNVYDLCIPGVVASPLVIGERQGLGESIEPGGFHGCFWVVPRPVLDHVGLLDERYEHAYWEDNDFLTRLREASIPTRQVASVRVRHIGALSTLKVHEHRTWLEINQAKFEQKWGSLPDAVPRYRQRHGSKVWHFCQNCPDWPRENFQESAPSGPYSTDEPPAPPTGTECEHCLALRERKDCAFY